MFRISGIKLLELLTPENTYTGFINIYIHQDLSDICKYWHMIILAKLELQIVFL